MSPIYHDNAIKLDWYTLYDKMTILVLVRPDHLCHTHYLSVSYPSIFSLSSSMSYCVVYIFYHYLSGSEAAVILGSSRLVQLYLLMPCPNTRFHRQPFQRNDGWITDTICNKEWNTLRKSWGEGQNTTAGSKQLYYDLERTWEIRKKKERDLKAFARNLTPIRALASDSKWDSGDEMSQKCDLCGWHEPLHWCGHTCTNVASGRWLRSQGMRTSTRNLGRLDTTMLECALAADSRMHP